MSRITQGILGIVLLGIIGDLGYFHYKAEKGSPPEEKKGEPSKDDPIVMKTLAVNSMLGKVSLEFWTGELGTKAPYQRPEVKEGEPPPPYPILYIDSQMIGEAPLDGPLHLQEGHYLARVVDMIGRAPYRTVAPFYTVTAGIDVVPGSDLSVVLQDPPFHRPQNLISAAAARADIKYWLEGMTPQKRLEAYRAARDRVTVWRAGVVTRLENARYDPLVQQLGTLYDAAIKSPPSRNRFLFRGVPLIGPSGKTESADLELEGAQVEHLSQWLVFKHKLAEDATELKTEGREWEVWQGALQALGNQDALTEAWSLANRLTALLGEEDQLRSYIERTGKNLGALLSSVEGGK
jgi:hypothetical protein